MAAAGTHPNIVRYYSSWTEQQGDGQLFYILMEKCDESLGHKQKFGDRSFKEAELVEILRQVRAHGSLQEYPPQLHRVADTE